MVYSFSESSLRNFLAAPPQVTQRLDSKQSIRERPKICFESTSRVRSISGDFIFASNKGGWSCRGTGELPGVSDPYLWIPLSEWTRQRNSARNRTTLLLSSLPLLPLSMYTLWRLATPEKDRDLSFLHKFLPLFLKCCPIHPERHHPEPGEL